MRGLEVCVCVSVCLSARSCSRETLRFSTAPSSEPQSILDRGLRFPSSREAGCITSALTLQKGKMSRLLKIEVRIFESLSGYQVSFFKLLLQIRGQMRVKCHFVQ